MDKSKTEEAQEDLKIEQMILSIKQVTLNHEATSPEVEGVLGVLLSDIFGFSTRFINEKDFEESLEALCENIKEMCREARAHHIEIDKASGKE